MLDIHVPATELLLPVEVENGVYYFGHLFTLTTKKILTRNMLQEKL